MKVVPNIPDIGSNDWPLNGGQLVFTPNERITEDSQIRATEDDQIRVTE